MNLNDNQDGILITDGPAWEEIIPVFLELGNRNSDWLHPDQKIVIPKVTFLLKDNDEQMSLDINRIYSLRYLDHLGRNVELVFPSDKDLSKILGIKDYSSLEIQYNIDEMKGKLTFRTYHNNRNLDLKKIAWYDIKKGPEREQLLEIFQHAFAPNYDIPFTFEVERHNGNGRRIEVMADHFVFIQHEDGSGNSFNIVADIIIGGQRYSKNQIYYYVDQSRMRGYITLYE